MSNRYCEQCSKVKLELEENFGDCVALLDGWKLDCGEPRAFRDIELDFPGKPPHLLVLAAHPCRGFKILIAEFEFEVEGLPLLVRALKWIQADNVAIKPTPGGGALMILPRIAELADEDQVSSGRHVSFSQRHSRYEPTEWEQRMIIPEDRPPFLRPKQPKGARWWQRWFERHPG